MVILGGETLIIIENALVTVLALASVTLRVTLLVPAAVGMPEIRPVEAFNVSPLGKLPLDFDQVKEAIPPLTANVWL